MLRAAVRKFGDRAWATVAVEVPGRSSKSCSDRCGAGLRRGRARGPGAPGAARAGPAAAARSRARGAGDGPRSHAHTARAARAAPWLPLRAAHPLTRRASSSCPHPQVA
jgi:hypothetical protein